MVIIPALVFVGGLYYASRGMSLLTTAFLGLITVEGRLAKMENEELHHNNHLGENPKYKEFLHKSMVKQLHQQGLSATDIQKYMVEHPPSLSYSTIFIETRSLSPSAPDWLPGNWFLNGAEAAQLFDVILSQHLQEEFGDGEIFARLCRGAGLDPLEIKKLSAPYSNPQNVNLRWLRELSDNRLSDPEFMAKFKR